MTTFGVDLSQHLSETGTQVPHLLAKCIAEIDQRGIQVKVYQYSILIYYKELNVFKLLLSLKNDLFF